MNKLSKRLLTAAILLLGWTTLILMQWSSDFSTFSAMVALPIAMLLMGSLAALTECD